MSCQSVKQVRLVSPVVSPFSLFTVTISANQLPHRKSKDSALPAAAVVKHRPTLCGPTVTVYLMHLFLATLRANIIKNVCHADIHWGNVSSQPALRADLKKCGLSNLVGAFPRKQPGCYAKPVNCL